MMEKNSGLWTNCLYRMVNAAILVLLCLLGVSKYLGIAKLQVWYLGIGLIAIIFMAGMNYLRFRGRFLLVLGFGSLFIIAVLVTGIEEGIAFLNGYISWLFKGELLREEWQTAFEILQVAFVAFCGYLFEMAAERYFVMKGITACALAIELLVCLIAKRQLAHSSVVFTIWYVIMVYIEWTGNGWKKVRSRGVKSLMLWITPFALGFLILMLLMPAPKEAYKWPLVRNCYEKVREVFIIIGQNILKGDGEDFGITMSGFSEEGDLQGNIRENNQEVMIMKGERGLITNVYLVGKVFDSFDGREWKQNNTDITEERLVDTLETLYAVERYEGQFVHNYIYETKLRIRYQYFNSEYVFTPLKSYRVNSLKKKFSLHQMGGNQMFDEKMGYGTEYEVNFYQINVDHPQFYHFLEESQNDNQELWKETTKRFSDSQGNKVSFEDLETYRESVYRNYLPETTLSPEVKAYLEEITKAADTDVDKLKAVEKELSTFAYTKSPGKIPFHVNSQEDFMDYFLLDSREGYCTYYATAFVLLARELGIPARYVQGFCVPAHGSKEVIVYSAKAHAWPEVYIKGVGWIPFEPTPGYQEVRYTPWEMQESNESEAPAAGTGIHYWGEQEEGRTQPPEPPEPEMPEQESRNMDRIWKVLGYTALLILSVCILMFLADSLIGRYHYYRKNAEEKFRAEIVRNLRILTMLGFSRAEKETLQELQNRAEFLEQGESEYQFIKYYEEVLYGNRTVTDAMTNTVKQEQRKLLNKMKQQKGKAYIIYRIRLYLVRYR